MVKKNCYNLQRQTITTFCFNCSKKQREFCQNIMGRLQGKAVIIRSKTLKEKGYYCSCHPEQELNDKGICDVCEINENEYLYEQMYDR